MQKQYDSQIYLTLGDAFDDVAWRVSGNQLDCWQTMISQIEQQNTQQLTVQRCPVCKRVLMATNAISGTVRVKCPRCGEMRDVKIKCREKKES